MNCGLPDYHRGRGRGDGIGSCCQLCGAGPQECDCDSDYWCCGGNDCIGACGGSYPPVETVEVDGSVP